MRNKSTSTSATPSNLNSVSGLNNLGNSCFFNAVLQNVAQAPYLLDLLKENFGTQSKHFLIRHNSEFDSELDDDGDESSCAVNESSRSASVSKVVAAGDSDSSSDVDLVSGDSSVTTTATKSSAQSPRSMRLSDLHITVKEASGPLTRQLFETIKSMTTSRTTVNPSPLFGQICKKIPSYKGFQQQDSHELLINLLDSLKTEELKRRQAGILEALRVNPKALDELSKRRIKRYGRLASYTFVDTLFGGHLLSSVVCEDCKTCSHRIEPFLDLSLPIVDESSGKQTSLMSALAQTGSSKIANVGSTFQKAKGKLKTSMSKPIDSTVSASAFLKEGSTDSVDSSSSSKQLSKHQLKKQQQQKKKSTKKAKRKGRGGKDEEDDEANENEESKEVDSVKEAMCKLEIADKADQNGAGDEDQNGHHERKPEVDTATGQEHDDNEDVVIAPTKNSGETEHPVGDSDDEEDDDEEAADDETDEGKSKEYKFMNAFRLEAMKNAGRTGSDAAASDDSGCSIQLCLAKFTANELLREKLGCDFCTNRLNPSHASKSKGGGAKNSKQQQQTTVYTSALKQYLICELPAVLIIHLKRFQQHGYRLEKSNKHVAFSLLLDMSPYTSKMCVNLFSSKSSSSAASGTQAPQAVYSLFGLVEHSGRLNSGHYTAYVKSNPKPGFHRQQAAFLGSHRICHLKSMLKRWNGKNLAPKSVEEELMYKESQEVFGNQYIDLDKGSSKEFDEDESGPGGAASNSNDSSSPPAAGEDKWYYVSDTSVSEVSVAKVLKAQAYLLFYERIQ